jgi:hypothetical protein
MFRLVRLSAVEAHPLHRPEVLFYWLVWSFAILISSLKALVRLKAPHYEISHAIGHVRLEHLSYFGTGPACTGSASDRRARSPRRVITAGTLHRHFIAATCFTGCGLVGSAHCRRDPLLPNGELLQLAPHPVKRWVHPHSRNAHEVPCVLPACSGNACR